MSYYIRVFGVETVAPTVREIRSWAQGAAGSIESDYLDSDKRWQSLRVLDENDQFVAVLSRDLVDRDNQESAGADDVSSFAKKLEKGSPRSAAEWVQRYVNRCSVVYCMQVSEDAGQANGWKVISLLVRALKDYSGGISHKEGEGFFNEEGFQITWELADEADGAKKMAVRNGGYWLKFQMDLANQTQRKAFLEGRYPEGALLIED